MLTKKKSQLIEMCKKNIDSGLHEYMLSCLLN